MSVFRGRRKAGGDSGQNLDVVRRDAIQAVSSSGVQIPGYQDFEVLARGGSSVVFRATELRLNRPVAIKVVPRISNDAGESARFQREKEIAALLGRHPHIVQVLDAGETSEGSAYLVMEYFENGSLADRVRSQGPLSISESLDIIIKISDALGAAHAADVLHRDVKPSNILMSQYGPALADFGISRSVSRGEWTQTLEQFTPWHAAPEILEGENPSIRSDLYSLASTLTTLLTGRPPFSVPGDERPLAYNLRVLSDPPPTLTRVDMPRGLQEIITRALAKSPDDRYESAGDFGTALSQVVLSMRTGVSAPVVRDETHPGEAAPSSPTADGHPTEDASTTRATESLWSRKAPSPAGIDSSSESTATATSNNGETKHSDSPLAVVKQELAEWAAPTPEPTPTSPPEPFAPMDTEQLARARAIGALRPAVSNDVVAQPIIPSTTAQDERTMVVRRGEVAPAAVEPPPPKQRDRFKVVVSATLVVGALFGAAIAFWPVSGSDVPAPPTEPKNLVITPVIGPSSPQNLSLIEESVTGVIGLNDEGITETSLKETDDLDHAVEIRWDDGNPAVDATYAVIYPTGGKPRNVIIPDPKSRYVSITGIKSNGRYCFWLVAIKDLQNSFRSEQQCIREGRPFTFPDATDTTPTGSATTTQK